jgi:hypothetical protein
MVKSILKLQILRKKKEKRAHRLKLREQSNKNRKSKAEKKTKNETQKSSDDTYINYYLEERTIFLLSEEKNSMQNLLNQEKDEFCEATQTEIQKEVKYKQENRALVLIGLEDIINQLCEKNKDLIFPDNFRFSVIALFDYYLTKSEKQFNRPDLVKSLYSCLDIIDKEQNLGVFTSSFFHKYINYEIEIDILETIDINLNPVKIFDYFDIFYFKITQIKKNDKKFLEYMIKFKQIFLEMEFYFAFHENSKTVKPSINFVSCLLLTYEQTKNMIPKGNAFIELYQFINYFVYSEENYSNSKNMIKDSISVYNEIINKINLNK